MSLTFTILHPMYTTTYTDASRLKQAILERLFRAEHISFEELFILAGEVNWPLIYSPPTYPYPYSPTTYPYPTYPVTCGINTTYTVNSGFAVDNDEEDKVI